VEGFDDGESVDSSSSNQ